MPGGVRAHPELPDGSRFGSAYLPASALCALHRGHRVRAGHRPSTLFVWAHVSPVTPVSPGAGSRDGLQLDLEEPFRVLDALVKTQPLTDLLLVHHLPQELQLFL